MKIPFLTAEWRDVLVVNFEVDPTKLTRYLPRGTKLDFFDGKAFLSLVAFRFNKTRLFGLLPSVPHYSFDEINLRFYVTRDHKRGVTFIREVVPSKLIAKVARVLYQEPYEVSRTSSVKADLDDAISYSYKWGPGLECEISARAERSLQTLEAGSFEEFILEHYWGYTAQGDASTIEYHVRHPSWRFRKVLDFKLSESVANFYSEDFKDILKQAPDSVLVAEGSPVLVSVPSRYFHPLPEDHPKGWVLYDGLCGFCSEWIPFWRKAIQRAGYDTTAVQSEWVKKKLGMKEADLNNDIRLLLNDGTLVNGADAYIYGMKRVWWSFLIGWILGLPGFRQVTWTFYKAFNRNRFLVSRMCRLKPEIEEP